MDMQNVSNLVIPEGEVRTIHDKNGNLLWGKVNYNVKYVGDTFQQTYSGKNLLHIPDGISASNGITWTRNGNTVSGTTTGTTGSYSATSAWLSYTLPAGTYTFSIGEAVTKRVQFARRVNSSSSAQTVNLPAGDTSITFTNSTPTFEYRVVLLDTSGASITNYTIKDIQLEAGSEATSFEPYVGGIPAPNPDYPQDVQVVAGEQMVTVSDGTNSQSYTVNLGTIELCKIGDYQDYIYKSGDDWYVHKEVSKVVLDGSNDETWSISGSGTANFFYAYNTISDYLYTSSGTGGFICSAGIGATIGSTNTMSGVRITNIGEFRVRYGTEKTLANWKSYLSATPMSIYYVLSTETDTQITDASLIGQLDAIHQLLIRYGYNATVSGNLPLIINKTNL